MDANYDGAKVDRISTNMRRVIIEESWHAEPQGQFASRADALEELQRRARAQWNQEPNRAPCASWRTCGLKYELWELDDNNNVVTRVPVLEISAEGLVWAAGFGAESGTST